MKNCSFNTPVIKNGKKLIFSIILLVFLTSQVTRAQENASHNKSDSLKYTWERFSINLGGFIAGLNSDVQLGFKQLGLGVNINVEDALGLERSRLVLRSEIEYNFGKRRRSAVKFGYFALFRNASKVLESEITIGNETFPIGTEFTSRFNLQIIKGSYNYSFYSDERVKLGASIGLFVMPISFSTSALGLSEEVADFIAPLPVLGLGASFAITPKLYIKHSADILYLEISDFKGSITDFNMRLEYNPWKHLGFGLGVDSYRLNLEAYKEDNPIIKFKGSIKTSYTGVLFYVKYFF